MARQWPGNGRVVSVGADLKTSARLGAVVAFAVLLAGCQGGAEQSPETESTAIPMETTPREEPTPSEESAGPDESRDTREARLFEAVQEGDRDQVRRLVARGAAVDVVDQASGLTALDQARAQGTADLARLLSRAQDTRLRSPRDAAPGADASLLEAAATGDPDGVALALREGAGLEARDGNRRTALLLAATYDRVDVARLLVALGADPDALDDRHDTPWLVTGVTGSVPMLEALLPAHPDLTIRNRYGGISVIPASERGHVAYVRRVVQTGIDVNHVNDLGWTALLEAVILGDGSAPYQQIVGILLDAGADPEIADGDGATALEHARARGQDEVAALLSAAGQR